MGLLDKTSAILGGKPGAASLKEILRAPAGGGLYLLVRDAQQHGYLGHCFPRPHASCESPSSVERGVHWEAHA